MTLSELLAILALNGLEVVNVETGYGMFNRCKTFTVTVKSGRRVTVYNTDPVSYVTHVVIPVLKKPV